MKRVLPLLLLILSGCGEDESPQPKKAPLPKASVVSMEDVDQLVEEVLLDEEAPEPGLSDEEIDALVEDFLMEEVP